MPTPVHCEHCGKFLYESTLDNKGAIASEAKHKGFVTKFPIFYGTPEFKIFCNTECKDNWWKEHVSPEQQKEGDQSNKKFKEDLTSKENIERLQNQLSTLQRVIKNLKS